MGHEACRAAYMKLVEYIVSLQHMLACAQTENTAKLLDTIREKDELLQKYEKDIRNMKLALNQSEQQMWRYNTVVAPVKDSGIPRQKQQAQLPDLLCKDEHSKGDNSRFNELETDGCAESTQRSYEVFGEIDRGATYEKLPKDTSRSSDKTYMDKSESRPSRARMEDSPASSGGERIEDTPTSSGRGRMDSPASSDGGRMENTTASSGSARMDAPDSSGQESASSGQESASSGQESGKGSVPVVSVDFVKKLLNQNTHLKRILGDLLQIRGITISDYLNKCEYEDHIDQLRRELHGAKLRADHFSKILDEKDNKEELMKICHKQVTKISQLQRSEAIQKVLAEAFSQQYNKVKMELTESRKSQELKAKTLSLSSEIKRTETGQTKTVVTPKDEASSITHERSRGDAKPTTASTAAHFMFAPQQLLPESQKPIPRTCAGEYLGGQKSAIDFCPSFVDVGTDGPSMEETKSIAKADKPLNLICERCDRPFDNEAKWREHVQKCQD